MASSKKGSGEHPAVKEYLRNLEAFEKEASSKPPPPDPADAAELERRIVEDAESRRGSVVEPEEKSPDTHPERPEEP